MNVDQIKELTSILESSKLKKIVVKNGEFELHLEKEGEASPAAHLPPPYYPPRAVHVEHVPHSVAEPVKAAPKTAAAESGRCVTSPMVGTFYAAASPDQPPFVKVGDRVEEHTVVCIVEAMKVMNEVKAGVKGTVVEVLLQSSQPVEFGTKMFRIE